MAQQSSKPSILIVEDEWVIALDIKQHLKKLGYNVSGTANSAEKALELVAAHKPDLVLMDIYLQGDKSGIEAADQIRQQFEIPVVFLTAHADESTLTEAIATHPYGYIVKPFEEQDLIIAIQVALANHIAEQAIRQALQKEKRLNELKSQFVSIVSHEFRNPLSSILLTLELLEQPDIVNPQKRQAHIERGKAAIQHMAQLITDVLVLGQVEQEQFHYQPTPINIYQFCSFLVEDLQSRAQNPERFIFNFSGCDEPENLFYELDPNLLQHILNNLLENALKYSPDGTPVIFNLHCESDYIQFQVQDQGIGLTEKDLEKLFTPFHRGINVNKIPGTGLGLSITKKCVDAHGGQILVDSTVGVGTTFTVTLPALKLENSNSNLYQPNHD
ncbi:MULTISPECIES: hybrid sensor histidine kinase/response regulator [unclassified Tolypothrix]|uniref:hybrid sensor histidine kinase/response regulator n=1 Tax=unclassified Tolypothrix TaxID=2649714 RepID=UPI0005EAC68F|nr:MULTISPECIES: ATP-binding protein [unclassified Tolypothrix]BAY92877.1 response regulator receiver sensor signal transduction histidine kinase [Microchaete diplosiphon NIES-3275]EKF02975.1 sensor histidine kinase [Tolypothrix sp. PCC 7601]MBE9083330.1 response regulator [Tolypothrix sp. LEGE 11397]UYD26788.1 response regulator [Tolypothrix sp. PCC 7712]UYD37355.1 response regulator [Tolypothrix sp. PCC 7601]